MKKTPTHKARTLAAAIFLTAATGAIAGPFNGGIVTIVVPTPPGAGLDNAARLVAEPLSEEWGIPVVVENRSGAAQMIAAAHVAGAAPDGRTLLLGATPLVQSPHLLKKPAYDPIRSFTPLTQMFNSSLWLGINAAIPAKTVQEFLALARKDRADFSYSSPGTGSTPHLNMVLLAQQAKVSLLHVPYKGIAPAVVDAAGGHVSAVFAAHSDLLPHVQTGKMRILASTGTRRSDLSKDVPTFREAGIPGFDVVGFGGLLAPAGMPAPLAAELSRSIRKVLQRPQVRARLFVLGYEPVDGTQQEFGALLRAQNEVWKKLIVDLNIKAD